jgi:ribonuclease T2
MRSLWYLLMGLAWAGVAGASEPASGTFVADRACDAFQSMRKQSNPGNVRVSPGQAYALREVNGPARDWLRVEVPGATEPLRWVRAECGTVAGAPAGAPASPPPASHRPPAGVCSTAGAHDSYVLAMSWQPGFCEHVKYNGRKPECDRMADGRLVVTHLTLHGLWPNRQGCGTRYGSCGGAALDLRRDTVEYVRPWMPNFFYEQAFGRHEWEKHGTCTSMDDDTYFRRAVDAVKVFDASAAGRYIAANAGGTISKQAFHERLRADTGRADAANAVTLMCTNQQLFEVRVQLPVDFPSGGSLDAMLGPSLPTRASGNPKACPGDRIFVEASGR